MKFKTLLAAALVCLLSAPAHAVTMQGTEGHIYAAQSGTQYTADSNGLLSNVAGEDVVDLLKAGAYFGDTPDPVSHTASLTVPVATINSGGILFASRANTQYCIHSAVVYASGGTAAGCNSVSVQDNATSTPYLTWGVTGLMNGNVISFASSSGYITPGAGLADCGQAGSAVKIVKAGSSCTGMTNLIMKLNYTTK